jgi:hypothetical protein
VLEEVDPAFAGKVREAGLPGLSSHASRDAFTAREGYKTSPEVKGLTEVLIEVWTLVGSPGLGQDHHVRV